MWLKLKICFGYAILVLLLAFIVYQFRKEQVLRHMLRKEEKELAAIHSLAEKSYIGLLDLSTHAEIAITGMTTIWRTTVINDMGFVTVCNS